MFFKHEFSATTQFEDSLHPNILCQIGVEQSNVVDDLQCVVAIEKCMNEKDSVETSKVLRSHHRDY